MSSHTGQFLLALSLALGRCNAVLAGQTPDIANTIGVVTLTDSGPEPDSIRFYNADGTQWYVFSFFYDDSDGRWDVPNDDFKPLAFHPDYFLLCLAATRRTSDGYDVIVNEETGLTKHLRLAPFLTLHTWEQHVLSVFSLDLDPARNPIRTKPRDSAPIIPFPGSSETYHPVDVRGDWVRMRWGDLSASTHTGWTRWKVGSRLVIDFFYLD